jgi:hypothetical protein
MDLAFCRDTPRKIRYGTISVGSQAMKCLHRLDRKYSLSSGERRGTKSEAFHVVLDKRPTEASKPLKKGCPPLESDFIVTSTHFVDPIHPIMSSPHSGPSLSFGVHPPVYLIDFKAVASESVLLLPSVGSDGKRTTDYRQSRTT